MGKWLGYKCLSLQFRNMNNIMYVSVVAVFDFFYVLRTRIFNIKLKIKYTRMKICHREYEYMYTEVYIRMCNIYLNFNESFIRA